MFESLHGKKRTPYEWPRQWLVDHKVSSMMHHLMLLGGPASRICRFLKFLSNVPGQIYTTEQDRCSQRVELMGGKAQVV